MTGLPARSLLLATALLAAHAAAAQVGPPIRLSPPGSPPVAPPAAGQPMPAPPVLPTAPAARPAVPPPVGIGDGADPIFGSNQWDGTSRPVALALLRRLPTAIQSPTLRAIAGRLLIASAAAPAGEGSEAELLTLRLAKLGGMGDEEAIGRLLTQLPPLDPAAPQARLELLWLDGKSSEACALTKQQLSRTPTVAWQQSQVACAALAGERDEASLGLQILHEQKFADATFDALIDMASGNNGAGLPKAPSWSPISIGLAQSLKGGLPPDVLRSTDASVLRAVAQSQDTQPILRLAAAERAAILGAITPADLARLYQQIEFSTAEKADPAASARGDDGPRGRALLYVAIQSEPSPGQRAELLRLALEAAQRGGSFALAAKLYRPLLVNLAAAPELARMALPVGQALYLSGDDAPAKGWYQLARDAAGRDGGVAATRLWALGRLADGDAFAPLDADSLIGWYELQQRREAAAAPGRLALLYALIEGLGDAVPGPAWAPLVAGGKSALPPTAVDAVLSAELRSAAESARIAETTALVLISIGARLPGPEAALAAYDALVALRFAGLDREASALAIEIAVTAGL